MRTVLQKNFHSRIKTSSLIGFTCFVWKRWKSVTFFLKWITLLQFWRLLLSARAGSLITVPLTLDTSWHREFTFFKMDLKHFANSLCFFCSLLLCAVLTVSGQTKASRLLQLVNNVPDCRTSHCLCAFVYIRSKDGRLQWWSRAIEGEQKLNFICKLFQFVPCGYEPN